MEIDLDNAADCKVLHSPVEEVFSYRLYQQPVGKHRLIQNIIKSCCGAKCLFSSVWALFLPSASICPVLHSQCIQLPVCKNQAKDMSCQVCMWDPLVLKLI